MEVYIGIDIGSVTTKLVAIDKNCEIVAYNYLRTEGKPVSKTQEALRDLREKLPSCEVRGVGTTGSGRYLGGVIVGADVIKNEITSHAVAALHFVPDVQTVIEIGGQDSKIIILRDGVVVDFAMNTVCAAGTGSFLDHQALRLNIKIEDFGKIALRSRNPVRIAGRCTVFAESDMIHKQQMGHPIEDILYGLCQALVRNYLNNVGLGKEILPPIVFQGGVAFNEGMVKAFEEALSCEIIVPPHHELMGAIGVAILAKEEMERSGRKTSFKGFDVAFSDYRTSSFICDACPNQCEIAQIFLNGKLIARWGGRCDRWERVEDRA